MEAHIYARTRIQAGAQRQVQRLLKELLQVEVRVREGRCRRRRTALSGQTTPYSQGSVARTWNTQTTRTSSPAKEHGVAGTPSEDLWFLQGALVGDTAATMALSY